MVSSLGLAITIILYQQTVVWNQKKSHTQVPTMVSRLLENLLFKCESVSTETQKLYENIVLRLARRSLSGRLNEVGDGKKGGGLFRLRWSTTGHVLSTRWNREQNFAKKHSKSKCSIQNFNCWHPIFLAILCSIGYQYSREIKAGKWDRNIPKILWIQHLKITPDNILLPHSSRMYQGYSIRFQARTKEKIYKRRSRIHFC